MTSFCENRDLFMSRNINNIFVFFFLIYINKINSSIVQLIMPNLANLRSFIRSRCKFLIIRPPTFHEKMVKNACQGESTALQRAVTINNPFFLYFYRIVQVSELYYIIHIRVLNSYSDHEILSHKLSAQYKTVTELWHWYERASATGKWHVTFGAKFMGWFGSAPSMLMCEY